MGTAGALGRGVREHVLRRGRVTVGWFRARPGDAGFGGGSTDRPLVVFPRTAVGIRHDRRDEIVADPTTAMLYNPGDRYRRRLIDPVGDRCEWMSVPVQWWDRVLAEVDPDARMHDGRPADGRIFTIDHCGLPGRAYLLQRTLTTGLANDTLSTLALEERALIVLREVLATGAGYPAATTAARAPTRRRHRQLVRDTREFLAATVGDDLDLDTVAAAVGVSAYHLHRVFRRHTGATIHNHRTDLRLRAALEWLPRRELAAIAHDLGFSSHSHFSATFRRVFDRTPSQVRTQLAP